MIFLEHSGLNRINSILQSVSAPDRYFDSRLELVSLSKSDSMFFDDAALSTLKFSQQDTTSYFKAILNKCFQDYDFSNLNDSYFKHVKSLDNVVNTIYYNLAFVVGRLLPDFADEFWHTIKVAAVTAQQTVHLKDADIYTFDSRGEDDPFNAESCINSFNYFMLDRKQQNILFMSCITRTRTESQDKGDYTPTFQGSIDFENLNGKLEEDSLSDIDIPETA